MDSVLRKQLKDIAWCKEAWRVPHAGADAQELIRQCAALPVPEPSADLLEVIANSKNFPIPFPIDTVRLEKLKLKCPVEKLNRNIASTYPIVHERVVLLIANFLLYKRKHGSKIEKELYKNMSIAEFIDRILKKRAVTFMKAQDQYKLLSGKSGVGGWEYVGTASEQPPLLLAQCLSYDELKLSALLCVSGRTRCVNDGARKNKGVVRDDDIENDAIIIGVVGPRFKRINRMEYEDMLVTEDQNIAENGYAADCPDAARRAWRQLWDDFYQIPSTTHSELTSRVKLVPCSGRRVFAERWARVRSLAFDNQLYCRRISVTADIVLLEANARAEEERNTAFLNVIGAALFKDVSSAGDDGPSCKKLFIKNDSHPTGGINVQLQDREPSAKLYGEQAGRLLVLTYAWDSNAHPGNEFWMGKLSSSGDSAAACATQVAELHNAHVNGNVRGAYTRAASTTAGVLPLPRYCETLGHTE